MERINANSVFIQDFKGVEQSTDPLKLPLSQTEWMHGLLPLPSGRMQRIPGKKVQIETTTHGSVLTIQQLTFSRGNAVFLRRGTQVTVSTNLSSLWAVETTKNPIEPFHPMDGGYTL